MAKEKGRFADPDRQTREHQEIGMDCLGVIRTLIGENSYAVTGCSRTVQAGRTPRTCIFTWRRGRRWIVADMV